jgi:hypothetical protein
MGNIKKKLAVLATTLAVTFTGLVPVQAMPIVPVERSSVETPATDVQWRRDDRRHFNDRRHYRRPHHREGYYNGHRGYRDRRPGYRQHNGLWFPLAAFAAGSIIGGAASQPHRVSPGRYSQSHYAWCENRYKTYRASDNTFVANSRGERLSCNSPY